MENFWVNRAKRILSALWLLGTIVLTGRGDSSTNRFGFTGPEIFPIDNQIGHLRAADLDGDGLQDLVVVNNSRSKINLLYNQTGKTNQAEAKTPVKRELNQLPPDARFRTDSIASDKRLSSHVVADLNGDGREDLLLVNWDSPNPFRFRLQNEAGQLGPEIHFTLPPIRSFWADDLDGDHKTEVITIAQKSGRAEISTFKRKRADPLSGALMEGQFQVLPLSKTTKARRGMVWADINDDRLPDLLVAEPESGQLTVYFQKSDGTLAAPKTFPTLTGIGEIGRASCRERG